MDSSCSVDWSRFDRVFVQCYTGYASERGPSLDRELARVGLTGVDRHWSCHNRLTRSDRIRYVKPEAEGGLMCVLGHYEILKTAYELGCDHILVLEDDVRFLSDLSSLAGIVSDLPDDYDVAKFEWNMPRSGNGIVARDRPLWNDTYGMAAYGAAATAYSRRGIMAVIDRIESLAASGKPLRNIDDLGLHNDRAIRQYACTPVAAIQSAEFKALFGNPRDYSGLLSGGSRTYYGYGETAGCGLTTLHDDEQIRDFRDLVGVAWRGRQIRMLEVGSYRGESAKAFLSSGLVDRIYCVDPWKAGWDPDDWLSGHDMRAAELDFDKAASSDGRIVKCKGTIDDFVSSHSDDLAGGIDLVYIDASKRYEDVKHIIEVVRDRIRPTLGIAGRDFMYGCGVRDAVLDTLGFPYQVFNDTSWFFPSDGGSVPDGTLRYWRFFGGRLGNQLYYLMQVHRMGPGNVYAGAGTTMQQSFARLGGSSIVVDCDKQRYSTVRASGQHWKVGIHYTLDDLTSFVNDVIIGSPVYREMVERYGLNESAVAMHVRNTDFITHEAWGTLDRDRYMADAISALRDETGRVGKLGTLHVFSDDNDETRRRFGALLAASFNHVEYMSAGRPEDDLMRLALYRTKVLFNSTFSAWAGYIGDAIFGDRHTVVIPSVFYARDRYIEHMSTLATPRWRQVVAYLKDGRKCDVVKNSRVYAEHPYAG